MNDDTHLNQIEKWFIQMEHLPLDVAKKLSKVYDEYIKNPSIYDEFFFKGSYKYNDDKDDWNWGKPVKKG
jgi:hypothetical protein